MADISDPTTAVEDILNIDDIEWDVEDLAQNLVADPTADETEMDRDEAGGAADAEALHPLPGRPVIPIPLPGPILPALRRRAVSGRYRNAGGVQLELRVDVDGKRPMKKMSGDFYIQSGATLNYFGSFVVNAPTVTVTPTQIIIDGMGTYTWSAGAPRLRVTIRRNTILQPPGTATAQFLTASGSPGARYICRFVSPYFRTVQYEEDSTAGVTPFVSYNTGSLPSGGPARALTVAKAFGEAGIEVQTSGVSNVVPTGGIGASWSNAELHTAMQAQFSLWKNDPQWKVWLLTAVLHDLGPGLRGIMFDQQGPQRQGCAVFHQVIAGNTPERLREQIYVCVHELGHCFNLFHSFHKTFMNPPQPNRPGALSWMNYPQNYVPGGTAAFWNAFPFQFDDPEVVHLRHAYRNNIVMGANPFGNGAALEEIGAYADPIIDDSGLRLTIGARRTFKLGEPVVVEINLATTDLRGKEVIRHLHPNFGFVQLGIKKSGGEVIPYEPMIEHCMLPETITLDADRPSIMESAYLGYGKDGLYFDDPGTYELRAVYHALDGSRVVSNILKLRVASPLNAEDEQVSELMLGEEQGALLYLLGSDNKTLAGGNEALEELRTAHADHPLAVYAQLVQGVNAAREFKTITADKDVTVRPPELEKSIELLSAVTEASIAGKGVDTITLGMTMHRLADAQEAAGHEKDARETARKMLDHFRSTAVPDHLVGMMENQPAYVYSAGKEKETASEKREAKSEELTAAR